VADMPLRINELEQACIAMDAKKIHEEAHYFRGASLQIRFTLLAKIAEKMENDAKDNSLDNMNILLKELKVEWETVKEILLKKME
jgi:HPt (histidine-containing phosphotransfer) domain-containing protein